MRSYGIASLVVLFSLACDGSVVDAGGVDADRRDATLDAGAGDAAADASDSGSLDAPPPSDAGDVDATVDDGGLDAGSDAGSDAGNAGSDAGNDAGSDAGNDAGSDAATSDPCSPLPSGLTLFTRSDSASVGTPDSYFLNVTPGDPFCASITGGGSGSWTVNVSNGTSSGLRCSGEPTCSIIVSPGDTTLIVTAVTTDIGSYTLDVRYRPR